MELRVKDRLLMPHLFPKEGTFQQFNLKKSILAKIELSEKEREDLNIQENPETGRVEWDVEKDTPMEPMFTHEEMQYLKESCEKLSETALHDDLWGTVEKLYNGK